MDYYSLRIIYESNVIFYGYFSVQHPENLITAVYDFSLPIGNAYTDVLLPMDDYIFPEADNIYVNNAAFTDPGINIYSSAMQTTLDAQSNHFNLYVSSFLMYIPASGSFDDRNNVTVEFQVIPIEKPGPPSPPPPPRIQIYMGSLFTNNSQVYYKPHSFSSGGSVTNSRAKKRRT
jgi:hypothetical protein